MPPSKKGSAFAQVGQADRKEAEDVIPDSSSRAIHGAGRFTLLPGLPAPQAPVTFARLCSA